MAESAWRHFVLVEPFRTADVSIFTEEGRAIAYYEERKAAGKRVHFVSHTGTVNDLKGTLQRLRTEIDT